MSNQTSTSSGISFTSLLTIVFITLKLCKVITWSWLWVLSPLWISLAVALSIYALIGLYYAIKYYYKQKDEKARLASGMNIWGWHQYKKAQKNKKK